MNHLPRFEVGLTWGKWPQVWPDFIQVLREIDRLAHPDDTFDEAEPDPEDALRFIPPTHTIFREHIGSFPFSFSIFI